MNSLSDALVIVLAMGGVILFCRSFPFIFFALRKPSPDKAGGGIGTFFDFVEKIVPPVAMTVLAFNILGTSFRENPSDGLLVLAASVFTSLLHLWKRNPLVSIFGGTALYMALARIFAGS